MPTIDSSLRQRLVAKYGTSVNLEAGSPVASDILRDLVHELSADDSESEEAGYDKSYVEGYNRQDYTRTNYSRYDRTDDTVAEAGGEQIGAEIRPELDRLIIERLRAAAPAMRAGK
ncbi:MAG TPA: hypothetical protein VF647_05865 [Longimicrobium sp.]|jgi:hypothetical protein